MITQEVSTTKTYTTSLHGEQAKPPVWRIEQNQPDDGEVDSPLATLVPEADGMTAALEAGDRTGRVTVRVDARHIRRLHAVDSAIVEIILTSEEFTISIEENHQ